MPPYAPAGHRHGSPLLRRLPSALFLGSLGLFCLGSYLHMGKGASPVQITTTQLVAAPAASSSSSHSAELARIDVERREQQLAQLTSERDALKAQVTRLIKEAEEKEEDEEEVVDASDDKVRALTAEREALLQRVEGMAQEMERLEKQLLHEKGRAAKGDDGVKDEDEEEEPDTYRQPPLRMPAWTLSHRFYALGAILTRDQIDDRQFVDVMLGGRKVFFKTSSNVLGVRDLDGEWGLGEHYNVLDPHELVKEGARFYCRAEGEPLVEATLVPVHTTLDPNPNGVAEIIRCPVEDGGKVGELDVTLFLQDAPDKEGEDKGKAKEKEELLRVVVPRATRTTGYFNYTVDATKLDPWQAEPDKLHLCVPGICTKMECPVLDVLLEFTEYHLQMGVDHIHFAADFRHDSKEWDLLRKALQDYIDEGKVSVMSTQTVHGPGWLGPDHYKLWHINSCLAYTKGLARWVGVWDLDEFIVPRRKGKNIMETIEAELEAAGGKTEEDTCHLHFTSYAHIYPKDAPANRTWIGQVFAKSREALSDDTWQKVVVSNRNVYYTGFHLPGACRATGKDWRSQLPWEEGIHVNRTTMAMMHYRNKLSGSGPTATEETADDEYASLYFPEVVAGLKRRRADELVLATCGYRPDMEP